MGRKEYRELYLEIRGFLDCESKWKDFYNNKLTPPGWDLDLDNYLKILRFIYTTEKVCEYNFFERYVIIAKFAAYVVSENVYKTIDNYLYNLAFVYDTKDFMKSEFVFGVLDHLEDDYNNNNNNNNNDYLDFNDYMDTEFKAHKERIKTLKPYKLFSKANLINARDYIVNELKITDYKRINYILKAKNAYKPANHTYY